MNRLVRSGWLFDVIRSIILLAASEQSVIIQETFLQFYCRSKSHSASVGRPIVGDTVGSLVRSGFAGSAEGRDEERGGRRVPLDSP